MLPISPVAWLSFLVLGFGLLIHITLVNLVLGLSVLVPATEYFSYRTGDKTLAELAKNLFRYLTLSDLIAGVFGTWIAVTLAILWPALTYVFTVPLFLPVTIAIFGVLISIPAIAIYYYTWNKLDVKLHLLIGVFMAAGALMVPTGFRLLFTFLNNPIGLSDALNGNLYTVFVNPMYLPLLLHSWFGGLTMSSLLAGGFYAWRSSKTLRTDANLIVSLYLLKIGLVFLAVQSLLGVVYFLDVARYSRYLFAAITGNVMIAHYDFSILFTVFLLVIFFLWSSSIILTVKIRKGQRSSIFSLLVMFSAFLGVPLGESLNDASRIPFMVISGTSGVPMDQFVNNLVPISWKTVYLSIVAALVTIIVFVLTVYIVYSSRSTDNAFVKVHDKKQIHHFDNVY
jgi:cytochrome d ubiquinol oxidase subunit I